MCRRFYSSKNHFVTVNSNLLLKVVIAHCLTYAPISANISAWLIYGSSSCPIDPVSNHT